MQKNMNDNKKDKTMDIENIENLFENNQLLVRAMDEPSLKKNNNKLNYDFSVWAEERDIAQKDQLKYVSSTLLISGEAIPTYKNFGFLLDSNKADIVHVADSDSGSGVTNQGDFVANETELKSLSDLVEKTKKEKLKDMNEVNINIKDDAIIGLFVNKCPSERPKTLTLLAQEYYKLHTGKELPIFIYDTANGKIEAWKMNDEEKNKFIQEMLQKRTIRSSMVCYDLDTEYTQEYKSIDCNKSNNQEEKEETNSSDNIKILRGIKTNPQETEVQTTKSKLQIMDIYKAKSKTDTK